MKRIPSPQHPPRGHSGQQGPFTSSRIDKNGLPGHFPAVQRFVDAAHSVPQQEIEGLNDEIRNVSLPNNGGTVQAFLGFEAQYVAYLATAIAVLGASVVFGIIRFCRKKGEKNAAIIDQIKQRVDGQAAAQEAEPVAEDDQSEDEQEAARVLAAPLPAALPPVAAAAPVAASVAAVSAAPSIPAAPAASAASVPVVPAGPVMVDIPQWQLPQIENLRRSLGSSPHLSDDDELLLSICNEARAKERVDSKQYALLTAALAPAVNAFQYQANPAAAVSAAAAAPAGFVRIGGTYVRGFDRVQNAHQAVARAHIDDRNNWHQSSIIQGATPNDYYLHTSRRDGTSLYLLQENGTHSDGRPMVTIVRQGQVRDGMHDFR